MSLLTATSRASPKPDYVRLPGRFAAPQGNDSTGPTRG